MARKGPGSTQRPVVTQAVNGAPPPSTIAAQIVSNAPNASTQQEPKFNAAFGQLLQEFLHDPSTDDPNSQLNAQLISVVAEAGLDALLYGNPFALSSLIPQAIDSLAVVKLTLQRNPRLILSPRENRSNDASGPPLFLWLLPKLLRLLGHPKFDVLQENLLDLLSFCSHTLQRTPDLWRRSKCIINLYKTCVDSILNGLGATEPSSRSSMSSFLVSLPPSVGINAFWADSQRSVVMPHGLQTVVKYPQAILIGLRLATVVAGGQPKTSPASLLQTPQHNHLQWASESCAALWQKMGTKALNGQAKEVRERVVLAYLHSILAICVDLSPMAVFPLHSPRSSVTLSSCFESIISSTPSSGLSLAVQKQLALALIKLRYGLESRQGDDYQQQPQHDRMKCLLIEHMASVIDRLHSNSGLFKTWQEDLRLAVSLWAKQVNCAQEMAAMREFLTSEQQQHFHDPELELAFSPLGKLLRANHMAEQDRPQKRPRLRDGDKKNGYQAPYDRLLEKVTRVLSGSPKQDLLGLDGIAVELYRKLTESERCDLLSEKGIGKIACAGSQSLEGGASTVQDPSVVSCEICDCSMQSMERTRESYWNNAQYGGDFKAIVAFLTLLVDDDDFQKSSRPRILVTLAIRRLFNHISDAEYLDLNTSPLGQWCLRSLRSSLRELRIAAGRALAVFLRDDVPKETRQKNRITALDFFRTLAERNLLSEQETLILAYGQTARACGDEELNIILIALVEYLGHPNPLLCGIAHHELSSIAESRETKPLDLLRPFWRSVGIAVVKDLHNRPQKAQQLADILGMTVIQMLLMTQTETLPYLVLTKRKDILQRLATARGTSVQDVCTQPRKNLAAILALLLRQPTADVEQNAMETLVAVAPAFHDKQHDLSSWIKLEPVLVACELLKAAAEEEEGRKPQVHHAFQQLAVFAEAKGGPPKTPAKRSKMLVSFFESHILGIMAHFSEVLDNAHGVHPISERRRCVGAIGEMIALAKSNVSIALPQIRACLQSAMSDRKLCDQTLSVWVALLTVTNEEEDLGPLIDQTYALITQNWVYFSDETQLKIYQFIDNLTKTHKEFLRERINFLPSLASIPLLSKFESEYARLKGQAKLEGLFDSFSRRCSDENSVVVARALEDLIPFLEVNQQYLQDAAISQNPTPVLPSLTRAVLDASVRFSEDHHTIPILAARCLGLIGCLDPYKVEAPRGTRDILVLSNFERATEVIDFTAFLLERVLVPVFHSTSNARAQGFLAYVMQELLKFCGFNQIASHRPRSSQPSAVFNRWMVIGESGRGTLTPFLNSRYMIRSNVQQMQTLQTYPIFSRHLSHADWLRTFVFDLLQRGKGGNAQMIFPVLARIIKGHDLSIATFILPFAALNVLIGGDEQESADIGKELLRVLETEIEDSDHIGAANIKQCSENVFQVLDYLSRWMQEKRKSVSDARIMAGKTGRGINEVEEMKDITQISSVESMLQMIPAEIISQRSVECGSYARALFHWEQYIRQEREKADASNGVFPQDSLFRRLQSIYAQIDEPDSIEGISAHLQVLDPNQQIMEHRKAGRWTAAQSWYEISLAGRPNDPDIQVNLLTCLKESGQYDSVFSYVEGFHNSLPSCAPKVLPFAAEAAWVTGKWQQLEKLLGSPSEELSQASQDFNIGVGQALLALRRSDSESFKRTIASLREGVAKSLSPPSTASLQACHDHLLRLHALYEIEVISGISDANTTTPEAVLEVMDRRLDVLGAYTSDKQYILGIRRAVMQLSTLEFTKLNVSAAWLTSARLARKANFTATAHNAVLRAAQLGDDGSKVEYARLLWKEGHHRKAIKHLEAAITSNAFDARDVVPADESGVITVEQQSSQNKLKAQAHLLLAKWLDRSGQSKSNLVKDKFVTAITAYPRWDKGHYYLGRHYLKILESEKSLPRNKQSTSFLCGETVKLVIDNFIRSMVYGSKYYYQTVPKVLTLWLDFGTEVHMSNPRAGEQEIAAQKVRFLEAIQKHIKKYSGDRVPVYTWYTALPQMITRISHPNKGVYEVLSSIILRIASRYPQQALWGLLAVPKATAPDRASRGQNLLTKLKDHPKRTKGDTAPADLKQLITHGQKLSDALLAACEVAVEQRATHVSLQRDLNFNHKMAPCALVVPVEATLIATLSTGHDSKSIRSHNPFPQGAVTIASFADDVLVLSSLQRPRKLTVRGSDGRMYGLLCKPKDDLRKDQRLMEFNAMINRALQRDIESSKRQLYIKTYGVTPLNEECGTIEWVEGLKPMRDIILRLYRQKNIPIDYSEIRVLLDACADHTKVESIFVEKVVKRFPPVLHEWFIETFPEPEAWCSARLRYTRSCAVMSIVGHVLGLGDRHGENVLLEEGNGGTFHVDFNCLFDKGLTFEKPELVPFRLTHNMVDAMGPQGVEGPFRTAAELTYAQLRQYEDTLITILETFVHDPTADFLGGRKKKRIEEVPETPKDVLESVKGKVGGLLRGESVPLSVEGYVDALIEMARDPRNLSNMYIGWCSFF